MKSFFSLQDLNTKAVSRSIAVEESTGALKIFSAERAVNICIYLNDYESDFNIEIITNKGTIVPKEYIYFGSKSISVNKRNNSCSFPLYLYRSSQNNDKNYFFIVVYWKTFSNTINFMVSSAIAAFSKFNIAHQSIYNCSFIFCNCISFNKVINEEILLQNYLNEVVCFALRENVESYIIFYENKMNNVDYFGLAYEFVSCLHNVSTFLKTVKSALKIKHVKQTLISRGNFAPTLHSSCGTLSKKGIFEDYCELFFSLSVARSNGQLNSRTNR
jgi:hypothetical protein